MGKTIKLKKGHDIKLVGEVSPSIREAKASKTYAIKPLDFKGLTPKLQVEVGNEVKAGTPLYFFKEMPEVFVTAPVSGEVIEIKRGAKRVILEIKILADSATSHVNFAMGNPTEMTTEAIKKNLLDSGAWTSIKQRPFGQVANPTDSPKNIFISGFDSAPLAPDYNFILKDRAEHFQLGINALAKLTEGKVYLGLDGSQAGGVLNNTKNVEIVNFEGPHPVGNVGVQIHHVAPLNKGEVVWSVNPEDIANIGKLFKDGHYDAARTVALVGSEVKESSRAYYKVKAGAEIASIIADNISDGNNRIISGNVLTGTKLAADSYLSFYDRQVTIIPEGDEPEFIGWLVPSYSRPSISKTFLSYLSPNKKFKVNTSMHGEERALVVTGEYEKVLPMDIYPQYLFKAIMANDLEAMEELGILEVVEEDVALCEFVCTSKTNLQKLIREGLDTIQKES